MAAKPENEFPSIKDMHEALASLIERGLGDLGVQILVAPDSTLQALARNLDPNFRAVPALMIDLTQGKEGRMAVAIISADRLHGDDRPMVTQ